MENKRRTIVGGRSRGTRLAGNFPRSVEVLLKKAKVDNGFREILIRDPLAAAGSIELELTVSEIGMLKNIPEPMLRTIIDNTPVPKQHVHTFRTAQKAAVLALLLGTTAVMPSVTATGQEEDPMFSSDQFDLASERMASVQHALELYKTEHGRYPSTQEWQAVDNPLTVFISNSDLFDPWQRKFHYEDFKEGGEIVGYRLESVGLDVNSPVDNIPCPVDGGKHLFLTESPLSILYPETAIRIDSAGIAELKAVHDNPRVIVTWYLDGKEVGQTVGENTLDVRLTPGKHTLKLVDENDYFAVVTFSVAGA